MVNDFMNGKLLLLTVINSINGKLLLLLTVKNFINGKWHSLTVLCEDDIAMFTCDNSFLNFLRCISQSRRIKIYFSFLEKLQMES